MRVFNFSAGPAVLPEPVLQKAAAEMLDWHGSGMSVMEMSHRGKEFVGIAAKAEADLRALLHEGSRAEGNVHRLVSGRAEFLLSHAAVWRPPAPRPLQPPSRVKAKNDVEGAMSASMRLHCPQSGSTK